MERGSKRSVPRQRKSTVSGQLRERDRERERERERESVGLFNHETDKLFGNTFGDNIRTSS